MTLRKKLSPQKLAAIRKAEDNTELFARNRARGISDSETLAAIIRNPRKKVILGLWGADRELDYCGIRFIRGERFAPNLAVLDTDIVDAIHCTCAEEAEAMRQVFGDDSEPTH